MHQSLKIETDRLILGRLSYQDIPKIIEYAGNEKVASTTLSIPHPYTEADAIYWINSANEGLEDSSQFTLGIRLKESNEFIGGIELQIDKAYQKAEMGYWIAESFWNKGYASEAVGAILRFGFNATDLNKIFAAHLLENPASGRVMIKNGMIKEAELKDHNKKGGLFRTLVQYRLTREEYMALDGLVN
jgi:ribosomal-protein-alanine N-acetyltransferase